MWQAQALGLARSGGSTGWAQEERPGPPRASAAGASSGHVLAADVLGGGGGVVAVLGGEQGDQQVANHHDDQAGGGGVGTAGRELGWRTGGQGLKGLQCQGSCCGACECMALQSNSPFSLDLQVTHRASLPLAPGRASLLLITLQGGGAGGGVQGRALAILCCRASCTKHGSSSHRADPSCRTPSQQPSLTAGLTAHTSPGLTGW